MEILAVVVAIAIGYHIISSELRQVKVIGLLVLIANSVARSEYLLEERFGNLDRRARDESLIDNANDISNRLDAIHKTLRGEDRDDVRYR